MKWNFRTPTAEALASDLGAFARAAWPILHPGKKLVWTWHYDFICEYLTLVKWREIQRLILNVPPRTAKSTIAAISFPVWCWLTDPANAFLCASYEMGLASAHNLDRRRLIQSAWFQSLFGDRFRLSEDRSQIEEFGNQSGGAMLAVSTSSRAQGRGGDYCIVDDPNSADDVLSDVIRAATNHWMEHMLPQRLNDPATSPIVVIQQRLHEADCTGFLLEAQRGEWTHIKLPLIAEEEELWKFPISGRVVKRKKGECLDPKRFPRKVVEARRRNRLVWAGQFQQEPAPIEGNLVKRSDVRYFGGIEPLTAQRDESVPASFDQKIISVDCAFKDLATSDYVAIGVIGVKGRKRFLLNVVNAHLDAAATEEEIRRQRQQYGPISAVLIEDKANGAAVISRLKANVSGVIGIEPQGGKIARMYAAAPEWQAGDWYVERNAAWAEPFVQQITMFPNARHDDEADMMSQASIWLQSHSHVYGLLDYFAGIVKGVFAFPEAKESTPRDENLNRQKELELEARLRGITVSFPPALGESLPPCPLCEGPRVYLAGIPIKCNQCGATFANQNDSEPTSIPRIETPCCSSFLPQIISGGAIRCGNCGRQSNVTSPTGVKRDEALSGRWSGGRTNMNPAGFRQAFARLFGGKR
ncbi:MAG: phage terminase large subunit [Candidatus Acidiferrum sp.]